jgi:hypothetical protein
VGKILARGYLRDWEGGGRLTVKVNEWIIGKCGVRTGSGWNSEMTRSCGGLWCWLCLTFWLCYQRDNSYYCIQARGPGGTPLPSWIVFDKATGLFEGVPSARDLGEHYVTIRTIGQQSRDWAKDVFSIDVIENSRAEASKGAVPLVGQHRKVWRKPFAILWTYTWSRVSLVEYLTKLFISHFGTIIFTWWENYCVHLSLKIYCHESHWIIVNLHEM